MERGRLLPKMVLGFLASRDTHIGPIARCTADLFDSAPFATFAVAWMNQHLAPKAADNGGHTTDQADGAPADVVLGTGVAG